MTKRLMSTSYHPNSSADSVVEVYETGTNPVNRKILRPELWAALEAWLIEDAPSSGKPSAQAVRVDWNNDLPEDESHYTVFTAEEHPTEGETP